MVSIDLFSFIHWLNDQIEEKTNNLIFLARFTCIFDYTLKEKTVVA